MINEKITEFGIQEKQLKAEIFKAELKQTEIEETRLSVTDFKQAILTLKQNRKSMGYSELSKWLQVNVEEIWYSKSGIKVHFKGIDLWV